MKNVWTKTEDSSSLLLFFFLLLFVVLWNGSPKIFLVLYLLQLWVYFGKTFLNLTLRMWFLSWSHPGELFCDLFEWALVFPGSPWHWGRGRDQRMSAPVAVQRQRWQTVSLGGSTRLPPKEGPCLLGSHPPDNGRSEPSSDFIYSRDWCVSGFPASEWCVNIRNSDTGWLKPSVLGIFSFQEILMWGMLEPHQQADKKGRQSRRGGNRTVRTDLKAVQGLSFPGRQFCVGILLQSQFLHWQNGDDNI